MLEYVTSSSNPRTDVSYSFRLIIDGCNGPIRFRERWLRQRASEGANPALDDGDDDGGDDDARRNGSTNNNNNNNNNNNSKSSLLLDAPVAYLQESAAESENDVNDGVILSLLRPETIGETCPQQQKQQRQRQPKAQRSNKGKNKNKNKNKKKNSNQKKSTTVSRETIPDRLDMIPLLRNLLASSSSSSSSSPPDSDKNHRNHHRQQTKLFDSVSVLFDGVSITKRPVIAPGHSEQEQDHEGFEGRLWDVRSNTRATLLPTTTTSLTTSSSSSSSTATATATATATTTTATEGIRTGTLTIEITGLYDEADNVIVDRVLDCHQKRRPKGNSIKNNNNANVNANASANASASAIIHGENSIPVPRLRIQTIRRTDTGAGKNRRLFRSLGLLRPESVACVYDFRFDSEFGSEFEWNGNGNGNANANAANANANSASNSDPGSTGNDENGPSHHPTTPHELPSAMFPGLTADGIRTLRSLTRNCPRGGLWNLDDDDDDDDDKLSLDVCWSPGNDCDCDPSAIPIVHIVATDDVFLRQRIVHEGGFVMTFAQLWLLLMDAREEGVHESHAGESE